MKNMNNQYRDNYEEVENQNEQQIYEFSEYPQIKEYYSNKMNTSTKKPKKIIVTEIFGQNPQSRNGLTLNKGYYKYYTQSNSPYHYDQKNLFYENSIGNNYLSQMNESYNLNNNISEGYSSDYNKFKTYNSQKNIFYNSCLREEYSSPTNDRVNIRKKIYRGSQTPQPLRNNYNISLNNFRNEENNNEPLIENFKYYEINNIKDRSNKKYNSITRVTGYSNLIPLHRRQIFYNDSRNIDIYRNNNINKSYNLEYNDSMINPSTTKEIRRVEIEKKEYNIPHINSQIKEKIKEYNNIKIQRKQKEESKKEKRKEFIIPPRKQTNEIKKASTSYTKIQKTTSTTRANDSLNSNAYKRRNENNQLSTKNNLTSKNNTSIGQYQYKKRTKESASTSKNNKSSISINLKNTNTKTNNTSSNYSKYQRKAKELTTTKSSSNIGSYKYQSKINTENNFKNNDKVEYRKHTGRYNYKTDIDKDILNSRKNYSQSKNVNKIEVVHQNKEKEKKYLQNRDNNTSSKVSSYQKTTKTSTSNYKNNNANNYKNSSTKNSSITNYKNSSTNNYKNSSTNNYKNSSTNNYKNSSTNNYKNSSSNYKNNINSNYKNNDSGNYKKRNDNYSSSRLIKETKITTTTTSKANANNYENKRKNNSSYKRSDQNINKNSDESKSIYNKYKFKLNQKVETNVSNASNVSKKAERIYNNSGNNENVGFIESKIVENRVYELPESEIQKVSSEKKMKMSMRKIALGDNYKYYERKFLLNPLDNSYTLHERRNERVIYGSVPDGPVGVNKVEIFKKKSPHLKKYKDKNKKNQIYKRNMYSNLGGGEDNYEMYNKYIMNNYSYNNGNGIGFRDGGYRNVEEINTYEKERIYYQ